MDPKIGRAEALRRAIGVLIPSRDRTSHPQPGLTGEGVGVAAGLLLPARPLPW
jgi:hypothetical protein